MSPSNCLFCRIVAGELPSTRVYEDEELVAFRDIQPAAPVHVLVVPREHVPTTDDLEPAHAGLVGRMVLAAARIAREEGLADAGYRLVLNCREDGGQVVFHLHLHILGGRRLSTLG